jgi:hypothetical protein
MKIKRRHEYEHHENCNNDNCFICDGGLAVCTVCGCAEGTLSTDCPGYPVPDEKQQLIYQKKLDFIDGYWRWLNEN